MNFQLYLKLSLSFLLHRRSFLQHHRRQFKRHLRVSRQRHSRRRLAHRHYRRRSLILPVLIPNQPESRRRPPRRINDDGLLRHLDDGLLRRLEAKMLTTRWVLTTAIFAARRRYLRRGFSCRFSF